MIALYKFRFYELDQPIAVGEEDSFSFFIDPHYANAPEAQIYEDTILVFANTLASSTRPRPWVEHHCRILSIQHPTLGAVRSIDTGGLDYTVTLLDGQTIVVNAEENPGYIWGRAEQVRDWAFVIDVEPVSAPG